MTVDVRGFGKGDLSTQRQLLVKNTLEWRLVYKFEMWVMRHNTEINVVLGMDFMIPVGRTTESLNISANECAGFSLQRDRPTSETCALWVRRTEKFLPTLIRNRRGEPVRVRLVNVTDRYAICDIFTKLVSWVPHGDLPRDEGYVGTTSRMYKGWQVQAYGGLRDCLNRSDSTTIIGWRLSHRQLGRPTYPTSTDILRRGGDDSRGPKCAAMKRVDGDSIQSIARGCIRNVANDGL
ncbi:hypothetical protein F444_12969 [Phytophthora nicotianae P1976]|uniref:Uncharacterized protein n=1 Tax=Phytophthora nicotianae P1976 TaxID=1317066 RepID=A0A080ZV85_PHYNI|nr:hypothetical protein F444_12969 [Phytophthora nicotianae P1976]